MWLLRAALVLPVPLIAGESSGPSPANVSSPDSTGGAAAAPRTIADLDLDLIWIPPGTFTMGSPVDEADRNQAEGPAMAVTLTKGFWLGKTEVTQAQCAAIGWPGAAVGEWHPKWGGPPPGREGRRAGATTLLVSGSRLPPNAERFRDAIPSARFQSGQVPGVIGTSNQKIDPPSCGKSAPTLPRSDSTSCFTMERPRPVLSSPPVGGFEIRAYSLNSEALS